MQELHGTFSFLPLHLPLPLESMLHTQKRTHKLDLLPRKFERCAVGTIMSLVAKLSAVQTLHNLICG